MKLKSITTRPTYNAGGLIEVNPAITIVAVAERTGSLTEGEITHNGIIEMLVSYSELLPDGSEVELGGRNDLDNKIVRPLQEKFNYIATIDENEFAELDAGQTLEKQGYFFLRKYACDNGLFGLVKISDWEIIE